ncbi:MAG: murein L,D-transpeptidase, partial [Alphaproteobacteria bacterium]|nr:murein L,D-transpeptidase [Alphaproteobacteria bacterium]
DRLLALIETAQVEGLDPNDYRPEALAEAIAEARTGSPEALAKAEMLLSRRFAAYVRDVRKQRAVPMHYVEKPLAPTVPKGREVLDAAAAAPSLQQHLDTIGWMHPIYGKLRDALAASAAGAPARSSTPIPAGPTLGLGANGERVVLLRERLRLDPDGAFDSSVASALRRFQAANGLPQDGRLGPRTLAALNGASLRSSASPEQQLLLRINLERARALPAIPRGRHLLVDAAAARLYLYENGQVRDSMRVVVGKPSEQTPMMAGVVRFAMINPYWNIPPDLVRKRVAAGVLTQGEGFLREKHYQILSDWSDRARVVDPALVDWNAVAQGRLDLRVRQLPSPENAMGKMKFMFPNALGVYLHDTPDKDLLRKSERQFSSGCVRLEDAPRLARWLFGRPLVVPSGEPETRVDLPEPVPVYITYLTAAPEGRGIAFRSDVYNRDGLRMAGSQDRSFAGR